MKRDEQTELPVTLLEHFLLSNKSTINQIYIYGGEGASPSSLDYLVIETHKLLSQPNNTYHARAD